MRRPPHPHLAGRRRSRLGWLCRAVGLLTMLASLPLAAANSLPGQTADNEIILRVDRYTFTKADVEVVERNHFYTDWVQLMIARAERQKNPDAITAAELQAMDTTLERRAIRTLISNTISTAEIPPDKFKEQYQMFGREYDRLIIQQFGTIDDYMTRTGWTREEVDAERRSFVAGQLRQWLIYSVLQQDSKVNLSEMRKYYETHRDQFTLRKGYKIRVLVLDPQNHPRDTNLYELAENLRRQYLDGKETFENLVRKYSDNEITKKEDGLWKNRPSLSEALKHLSSDPNQAEWITSILGNQLNPDWMAAAQQLDPTQHDRQISKVIVLKNVYSLVYLEATRPERRLEYSEVPVDVLRELAQNHKSDLEINRWTAKKLANARIVYRGEVKPYSQFWDEETDD